MIKATRNVYEECFVDERNDKKASCKGRFGNEAIEKFSYHVWFLFCFDSRHSDRSSFLGEECHDQGLYANVNSLTKTQFYDGFENNAIAVFVKDFLRRKLKTVIGDFDVVQEFFDEN